MSFSQQINIRMVITVGIVSALVVIVLILGTLAWFENAVQEQTDANVATAAPSSYVQARNEQRDSLNNFAWNTNRTAATIPTTQAFDILVQTGGKMPSTQP